MNNVLLYGSNFLNVLCLVFFISLFYDTPRFVFIIIYVLFGCFLSMIVVGTVLEIVKCCKYLYDKKNRVDPNTVVQSV